MSLINAKNILIACLSCVGCGISAFSQKPSIDTSAYYNWPQVGNAKINSDGKYVVYDMESLDQSQSSVNYPAVVRATKGRWMMEIMNKGDYSFTDGGKHLLFINKNDSLIIVRLSDKVIQYVPKCTFFTILHGNSETILYSTKNAENDLIAYNLVKNRKISFNGIGNIMVLRSGNTFLFKSIADDKTETLNQISFPLGEVKKIWVGKETSRYAIDKTATKICFLVNEHSENTIWYYDGGVGIAQKILDKNSSGLVKNMNLNTINSFSSDGKRIFFDVKEVGFSKSSSIAVNVNVWNYSDSRLQSQQLLEMNPKIYSCVLNLNNNKIIRLQNENELLMFPTLSENEDDSYMIIVANDGGYSEKWNKTVFGTTYLVSTKDGSRVKMDTHQGFVGKLSPKKKYYIYYNPQEENYFSYNISLGQTRNITKAAHTSWASTFNIRDQKRIFFNSKYWLENDSSILLNDEFDIWQIDPAGMKMPINLTNGFGRRNNTFFEFIDQSSEFNLVKNEIIVSAFNRFNKDNGFYKIKLGASANPVLLSIGKYYYFAPEGSTRLEARANFSPIKATKNNIWLVRRMSALSSPNFFTTTDFKNYSAISNVHPEKKVNWYTTELHVWKSPDSRNLKGVLYKPENFDPQKKYPVIFNYYEILSDYLNIYLKPQPSRGALNIAWYVSNGYLVFCPDIEYTIGEPMKSTYDCVISAANYISSLPFVNPKKMGIQGISWGGMQTNYLVTHTNLFAAACSASGTSDFISHYGSLGQGGGSAQSVFEGGQGRLGSSLWERPDWFVENSPIMSADNVTTPFLMFHTSFDAACPFPQAVELFTDLRRLGKKVWLLEYKEGNHNVSQGKPAEDFSFRMSQFFDRYLKDNPAPKWMTQGF
jgi:hypothetical protein